MTLILASTSPRRLELLKQIGITPDSVMAPDCDETPLPYEKPEELALRLSIAKAHAVRSKHQGTFIIAGDTIVQARAKLWPKCSDDAEVRKSLSALSGRRHRVIGGVCVMNPIGKIFSRVVETTVAFKRLHEDEISTYVTSKEGVGKAGGYAMQGRAAAFIKFISGSPSNVIGLPLHETAQLLQGSGYYDLHA